MSLLLALLLAPPSCATCHPAESRAHARTLMAQTLEPVETARILISRPTLTYESGPYSYRIQRDGDQSLYSVTDGRRTLTAPIRWAMGQGDAGQTYILDLDGAALESRVSFYNDIQGLSATIGAPPGLPKNLEEAVGRPMTDKDMKECFGCHSAPKREPAPAITKYTLAWTTTLDPGVQCENCHTGSSRHAAARQTGDLKSAHLTRLKRITTEEMSDLCGQCHRTWADISLNGPKGVANVRFQPYRIAHSKCYDAVDRRIGCTACHYPHNRSAPRPAAAVDVACKTCHQLEAAGTKASSRHCPKAQSGCASCHMPKYGIPGAHYQFTDHFIRIARPGEPYPN